MAVKVGDVVARLSYNKDILFRVVEIHEKDVLLKGINVRLMVDAPFDDIVKVSEKEQEERKKKNKQKEEESLRLIKQEHRLIREKIQWFLTGGEWEDNPSYELPGKVLHMDGDPIYLKKCVELYRELNIPCYGVHVTEKEIPSRVGSLLRSVGPDILVITGHDSFRRKEGDAQDLNAYRHSKDFVQAVKEARKYERGKDALQIFAGACQSNFEALLEAGANFGSSPRRINIHALDPVYVVEKIAFTPIRETINVFDMVKNTISGLNGIGGVETRGTLRIGLPSTSQYEHP